MRSCSAAEHPSIPTGLHRCYVVGFTVRRPVADPVDASMNRDQGAAPDSPSDPLGAYPRFQELPTGDYAVCSSRKSSDHLIRALARGPADLWPHTGPKSAEPTIRPGLAPFIAGFPPLASHLGP
jgi:hypothetical protein